MSSREALTTLILGLTAPRAADAILASDWLARVKAEAKAEALAPFEALFGGGPDTPCRTTWPEGIECVEVPMADLRAAFALVDPTTPTPTEGDQG